MNLLNDKTLENSPIVANNLMNRERQAIGINSYQQALRLNPITFLSNNIAHQATVRWLDLCCGSGKALIQSALHLEKMGLSENIILEGIDLVDFFDEIPNSISFLKFQTMNLSEWTPTEEYDLITCVHGLHYIGDKLKLIQKSIGALKKEGVWFAHLDLKNIILENSPTKFRKWLKNQGISYQVTKKLLHCVGKKELTYPWIYQGADDRAGANFTGQAAVTAYYTEN